jgi:FkbH-like protein
MILRRSQFAHIVALGPERALALHALTQLRLGVDREVADLISWFDAPRELPQALPELMRQCGYDLQTLAGCVASLIERGVLTQLSPEEERAEAQTQLAQTSGRDPGEMLERFRRQHREGGEAYWAVSATRSLAALAAQRRRLDLVLLGDCDLQMEADFLAQEGARWGLDLRVAATFPDDAGFVGEHPHDAILVGALRSRAAIAAWRPPENASPREADAEGASFAPYLAEARGLIGRLRSLSPAPILIDALPEPTLQPLGLADRGPASHRNRYRRANLALAELGEEFPDVHVVDTPAVLGAIGAETLLDDGLVSFTHFGSPGWMLQRPESEKTAVHDIFPDPAPLAEILGGDPYRRERVMARAHLETIVSVTGVDRKKCVIVDLDGVLWPGVLAETGSPFAWSPEISGPYSYIGLFFGLHEALKTLKRRGLVLAAVSKNDEAVVRALWKYPDNYPQERLLAPEDFVTWRVNWRDKAENISEIAQELGFALDSFLFVDDHPIERERIRAKLPEIEVWGEELFTLRRRLLTDPRLQPPRVTPEAETRTELVKAQLERAELRLQAADEASFLASLEIECRVEKLHGESAAQRVEELFARTTQFNATGRKFTAAELVSLDVDKAGAVYTMSVRDRFADHGLVAAAVVAGGEILNFALSCRVIGLGVELRLLDAIIADFSRGGGEMIVGKIIETPRNIPARHLYRDRGFARREDGAWVLGLAAAA